MEEEGAISHKDTGFGYLTDSPTEAVKMIVDSLPATVTERLTPRSSATPS